MPYLDPAKQRASWRRQSKKRRECHRQWALKHLGGKCNLCGTPEDLEFDHKDGSKIDNVTRMLTYSMERLRKEVDKCQLLCHECHEEVTLARAETLGDEAPF